MPVRRDGGGVEDPDHAGVVGGHEAVGEVVGHQQAVQGAGEQADTRLPRLVRSHLDRHPRPPSPPLSRSVTGDRLARSVPLLWTGRDYPQLSASARLSFRCRPITTHRWRAIRQGDRGRTPTGPGGDPGRSDRRRVHAAPGGHRCARADEYKHTAAAVARLRLSARPWMGTRTAWSASARSSARQAPGLVAEHPARRPGQPSGVELLVQVRLARAVGGQHPQARGAQRPTASSALGPTTTGTWNTLPAEARTALGL